MKQYTVRFTGIMEAKKDYVVVAAKNQADAYDKAVYDVIYKQYGELPYAAWVESVTHNNGRQQYFDTFAGKPFGY